MTFEDDVIQLLSVTGPLNDEITARLGVSRRQTVNQLCRRLERRRILIRQRGSQGKILNRLSGQPLEAALTETADAPAALLSEDEVKHAIKAHLESRGYHVEVKWGRERGIDIEASGPAGRLLLEAKGEVASQPQQTNYFIGALGELVQRMTDPQARYGLALPDNAFNRGLVARLPRLAWDRLNLGVYLVSRRGDDYGVRELKGQEDPRCR